MNVTVDLEERSYDVVIEDGARATLAALVASRAPSAQVCAIITSATLRHQPWFDFETGITQHVIEVPDGEDAKTLQVVEDVCEQLARLGLSRRDLVVGVGGGAVTDLAGLVAAVYLRGIGVIQVPTTVVGQVDAAVGGKTAVNLRAGKNLVGAFHQPLGVLCDTATLATLAERERRSGLGEVAKCWLLEERRSQDLATTSFDTLVALSVGLKAAIVSADETEGGPRALLNYGHTLAHAVELVALERGHDELRHGEAVAIGLAFAVRLARRLERVDEAEVSNHDEVLDALGLETAVPKDYDTDQLIDIMGRDKKAHHDLTFVLAGSEGFEIVRGIDPSLVRDVLETFRGER
jgi:5-deoxy-5-amino-3-dehydroquinate synthase